MTVVSDVLAFLQKWEFADVGELALADDKLSYFCSSAAGKAPSVYVIVAWSSEQRVGQPVVWYVGSAFRGWQARYRQHNSGFRQRPDRGEKYRKHLNEGGVFRIFERAAARYTAFDDHTWGQEVEEAILIGLLEPTHNRQKLKRLVSQNSG